MFEFLATCSISAMVSCSARETYHVADDRPLDFRNGSSADMTVLDLRCLLWAPRGNRAALLEHVVGASQHQWRHCEAERLGSLEIDDQFILGRKLRR